MFVYFLNSKGTDDRPAHDTLGGDSGSTVNTLFLGVLIPAVLLTTAINRLWH